MTINKTEAEPGYRTQAHNNDRASVRMNAGLPKHSEARLHNGPAPALKSRAVQVLTTDMEGGIACRKTSAVVSTSSMTGAGTI